MKNVSSINQNRKKQMKGFIKVTQTVSRLNGDEVVRSEYPRIVNVSKVMYFADHAVFFSGEMWSIAESLEELELLIDEATGSVPRKIVSTNDPKALYLDAKNSKLGEACICPSCGQMFVKKQYSQAFCSGKCKDKYWNDQRANQ